MRKKPFFNGNPPPNVFIGAKGGALSTPALLAAKLSVVGNQIKNFKIDANNNISCYIGRNYTINLSAFLTDSALTYYIDMGKCIGLDGNSFHNAANPAIHKFLIFPNVTSCWYDEFGGGGGGTRNKNNFICTPKLEPIGLSGTTSNGNYDHADFDGNCYVAVSNQTSNAGAPDPDIAAVVSGNIGSVVKYSTNANSPSGTTGLYTISATTTSLALGWDAVTHTNAIDYYVVFADGVYKGKPSATSLNMTGLSSGTTYEFKIIVIDEMGNNSKFSDVYSGSTL